MFGPNFVLWFRLGETTSTADVLRRLAIELGMTHEKAERLRTEVEVMRELQLLQHGKRCLLVLDDCWHLEQVQPFHNLILAESQSVFALVLTTRARELSLGFGDALQLKDEPADTSRCSFYDRVVGASTATPVTTPGPTDLRA